MKSLVGGRVKQLRQEKNLTQFQIAEVLGVDRSNYSKYELGKLEFSNVKLAKLFNVTTDYLLGLEKL